MANSFAVPFEEDEKDSKTWFLDHNYIENVWEMFKKVNGEQSYLPVILHGAELASTFSTGEDDWLVSHWTETPCLGSGNQRAVQTLHSQTSYGHRRCTAANSWDPYGCILRGRGDQGCMCFFARSTVQLPIFLQDGTETRKTFLHVPSAIEAEEAEEIGVEHLLRDIKDSTTTTLSTRVSEQLASLRGLQSRLSEIQSYLVEVSSGKLPVNHPIVYHLQDVFNLLPDFQDPVLTQSFTTNTNDQLLVVYLSSMLRAVIALHALVDNKEQNGRADAEEGTEGSKKDEAKKGEKEGEKKNEKDDSSKEVKEGDKPK